MRKHLFLLASLCAVAYSGLLGQTTINGSFVHDGITRTYSFYVPASYTAGQPVPLVIGLHGTSSNGSEFAQYRDFRPMADTANFITANPDGSTLFGIRFWNYGNVLGSDVDDVGFLEALIDTLSAQYSINPQRVYCAGMSNGSFMSYYMACQSNRFAAIAGVTGSMSPGMLAACQPARATPTIHIHGTDDDINPYEGNAGMVGIDALNRYWVNQNACDTTPVIFTIPNTNTGDGATAIRYLYTGGTYGNTVELFEVAGGGHSWPGGPMPGSSETTCMDFNASAEIWRFFSRYTLSGLLAVEEALPTVTVNLYPNPTADLLYIQAGDHIVTEIMITDMQGRVVEKCAQENILSLHLGHLKAGNYLANLSGNGFRVVKKLVIAPQ